MLPSAIPSVTTDAKRAQFLTNSISSATVAARPAMSAETAASKASTRFGVLWKSFIVSKRVAADVVNFIVRGDVYLPGQVTHDGYKVPKGKVVLTAYSYTKKAKINLSFSYPENMTPTVMARDISTDARVKRSWGDELIRISFTSKAKAPLAGQYEFKVELY